MDICLHYIHLSLTVLFKFKCDNIHKKKYLNFNLNNDNNESETSSSSFYKVYKSLSKYLEYYKEDKYRVINNYLLSLTIHCVN